MQLDWRFDHMGMIVTDLDRAVAHFKRAGFALSGERTQSTWPGPVAMVTLREQLLRKGCFGLQLQQPVGGAGLPTEFLQKHGEGIHYIGFAVSDVATASRQMADRGFSVLHKSTTDDGSVSVAYHDTRQAVDIALALISADSLETVPKGAWTFEHAGLVVGDMNKAIESYEAMGFKLFLPPLNMYAPGGSADAGLAMSMLEGSGFILEIMSTFGSAGDQILWGQFYKEHGGGVQHLHFAVDDLEKETAELEANGFTGFITARASDGSVKEVYFDTYTVGNVRIGLYHGEPRLVYEDTVKYLLDAGLLVSRAGFENTSRVLVESV